LFKAAEALGVVFQKTEVQSVSSSETGTSVVADGKVHGFDRMIIAAGVWSAKLAAQLGDKLPVEAEGGYNITYSEPGIAVSHPIVFSDHGLVSTALRTGLRIGGWAEYAGLDAPPKTAYFDRMETISRSMFPALNSANGTRWSGRRPSMPDSTPVISASSRSPNIYYATGHGHYGLSWAARTAEILLALLDGDATAAAPFSIRRFNKAA
jgi:D-amino-acid dehydrogenase